MQRRKHAHGGEGRPLQHDFQQAATHAHGCCTLNVLAGGQRCRIRRHHAHGAVRQRLLAMGFVPNAEVEVVRVATLGDPMELRVGDSFVTLRKREAAQIEVNAA